MPGIDYQIYCVPPLFPPQIAEGVSTAGAVVRLARQYRVSLPVLTAVAQICDNQLSPREAVYEIMALPQVEEV